MEMTAPFKALAPQDVLEAYYTNVQRSETIHMVMLDTDGLIVATNRATARLYGKTPDELTGQSWFELAIPKPERNAARDIYLKLLATGLPEVNQSNLLVPDGTIRTLLWSNSLMHAENHLTGIVSFGIDVTNQARATDELRLERQLLKRAESIAGLGTYVLEITDGSWKSSSVLDGIFGITDVYPRTIQGWLELVHPDDRAMMADYFNSHVLLQHQIFDKTYRILRKSDGAARLVQGFGELELASDGKVQRMLGTIQDITDQTHISQDLLESEARFRQLVQHSPDAIVILDADTGLFTETNPKAEELFGMQKQELLSIGPAQVSPTVQPDGRSSDVAARDYIQKAVNGDEPYFQWVHRTKQGVEKLCMIRLLRLPSHERKLVRGSITDISTEVAGESKSELRIRYILDKSPEDIIIMTADGTCTYANDSGMFGYSPEDVMGKNQFLLIHPDDAQSIAQKIQVLVSKPKSTLTAAFRIRHKNGAWRNAESTAVNLLHEPIINGLLIFTRDVTDTQKGKAAIIRVDELETMNQAMVGRELRIAELKDEIAKLKSQLADMKR